MRQTKAKVKARNSVKRKRVRSKSNKPGRRTKRKLRGGGTATEAQIEAYNIVKRGYEKLISQIELAKSGDNRKKIKELEDLERKVSITMKKTDINTKIHELATHLIKIKRILGITTGPVPPHHDSDLY
mgnify:FL=1|jgi:hypothetical protein